MQKFNFGSASAKRHELTCRRIYGNRGIGLFSGGSHRFLALSGLGLGNLRAAAEEPGFLAALLDHLASDEACLR
jgi:hypothetical protein